MHSPFQFILSLVFVLAISAKSQPYQRNHNSSLTLPSLSRSQTIICFQSAFYVSSCPPRLCQSPSRTKNLLLIFFSKPTSFTQSHLLPPTSTSANLQPPPRINLNGNSNSKQTLAAQSRFGSINGQIWFHTRFFFWGGYLIHTNQNLPSLGGPLFVKVFFTYNLIRRNIENDN